MPAVSTRFTLIMLATGALFATEASFAKDTANGFRGHPELDRLVADVCAREVVSLGEDAGHGSARAIETRALLVRRLVAECGFAAVAFESQIYDFVALEEAQAAGVLTREAVADAIGGLWSTMAEADELVDFLTTEASAGRIRLLGLDPQIGGATQGYTQKRLPDRLVQPLQPVRRQQCGEVLTRLTGWRYDAQHPYDDAARRELRACAEEIMLALGSDGEAKDDVGRVLARNFSTQLAMMEGQGGDFARMLDRRGHTMATNLRWHRERLGADVRIIVWSATVHTARRLVAQVEGEQRMGDIMHGDLGEAYAVIGFTAAAGSHARAGMAAQPIVPAAPGSLEYNVLGANGADLRYADHATLKALGRVPGHAFSYGQLDTVDWSQLLDGLVVFAEERPPHRVRAARPSAP